jgi:RNA-directed DNA polymerase
VKPIFSINDLAYRLGIPRDRLEAIAENTKAHYDQWPLRDKKNPAKVRQVRSPRGELKKIQKLLVKRVFSLLPLNASVHGGVRGRSAKTNAEVHLAQPCVITLDVKQYYDRVRHKIVYELLRKELGFGRDVARLLTRLTTFNDALPQGAPSSLCIANLLLTSPLDNPLSREAKKIGVKVTRFVDDIALSGAPSRQLINEVAKGLSRRRLPMYRKPRRAEEKCKLNIMPNSGPQEITGLLVNRATGPSLSRTKRDRVRAAINELSGLKGEEHARALQSIIGRIRHVRQYNVGTAKRLERSLQAALSLDRHTL